MEELIKQISWDGLSCHDRSMAYAFESLKKHSGLYFLLFKMIGNDFFQRNYNTDIGDDGYYSFISQKTGINIGLKSIDICDNVYERLHSVNSETERIIIVINSCNESRSNMYKKENHPHFIFAKTYDESNQIIKILLVMSIHYSW